jgi:hypothetical protein
MMKKVTATLIIVLFISPVMSGCTCLFKKAAGCNDEQFGPVAIRLADFSSQVVYYYRSKKESVPADFNETIFIQILKQLPPDQVIQKDVDSLVSKFTISAHAVATGFSVMLCKNDKKIMEDFADSHTDECKFDLNRVEIRSWNDSAACSFDPNWRQYCEKP